METIIITGAPATGKTTLRRHVGALLQPDRPQILDLGIDDILRRLHAEGKLSGQAELTPENALILASWEAVVPAALQAMSEQRSAYHGPAILEMPLEIEWFSDVLSNEPFVREALIIYLHAPLEVRVHRNQARVADRISSAGLIEMPAYMPPTMLAKFSTRASCMLVLNTNVELRRLMRICGSSVLAYLDPA